MKNACTPQKPSAFLWKPSKTMPYSCSIPMGILQHGTLERRLLKAIHERKLSVSISPDSTAKKTLHQTNQEENSEMHFVTAVARMRGGGTGRTVPDSGPTLS